MYDIHSTKERRRLSLTGHGYGDGMGSGTGVGIVSSITGYYMSGVSTLITKFKDGSRRGMNARSYYGSGDGTNGSGVGHGAMHNSNSLITNV